MFISNLNEAYEHGFTEAYATEIDSSMRLFMRRLNGLLLEDVPMDEWIGRLHVQMDPENQVEAFNYYGLTYLND